MVNISYYFNLVSVVFHSAPFSSPPLTSAKRGEERRGTDNATFLSDLDQALTVLATPQGKFHSVSYLSDASLTEG